MRRVRGAQLAKAMLYGAFGTAFGIVLSAAIDYARRDWTNPLGLALVVLLGCASGLVPILREPAWQPARPPHGSPPGPGPQWPAEPWPAEPWAPGPVPPGQAQPPRPARRPARLPVAIAVLVLIVACGGGATVVTLGVRYAGAYITGDQPGTDVLVAQRSATVAALTITVLRVRVTANFTRVEMTATNRGRTALTLPVFHTCQLTTADGTTLQGDPFRSDWPETVPTGGTVRGTVTFGRRLPAGTTSARLTFTQIFGTLGEERSITVDSIALRPV
jgi:hypothetical protein